MDARTRRLTADRDRLLELQNSSDLIRIAAVGGGLDKYAVTYYCGGLVWPDGATRPKLVKEHRVQIYLHLDYPRLPPKLEWMTDIFHPNILPPTMNGGVCIGGWSPSETLDRLVVRMGEMVQYRNYSVSDALNIQAARWAQANAAHLPVDTSPLYAGYDDSLDINLGG